MREVIVNLKYLALSCDEVTTIDNQLWILIHFYVVQDWCHLPILIFLEQVIVGGGLDNLIKVIMGVLKKEGGVFDVDVARKLMSFGVDGVNDFQGCKMVLFIKSKISLPPLGSHSLHGTVHQFSSANLISNPYCETRRRFATIILFFLFL
jgi:hypothetical protein